MFGGPTLDELVAFPRTGLQIGLGQPNLPGGRTDAAGVYNNLWGLPVRLSKRALRRARREARRASAAPITEGVNQGIARWGGWGNVLNRMWAGLEQGWNLSGRSGITPQLQGAPMPTLFSGTGAEAFGSGGTDWGSILGGIGQSIAGIYQTKATTRQLKQMNRLLGGRAGMVTSFAPSAVATVPAAAGAGGWGSAAAGALGGAIGGILGLGPDLLPGGLEEAGTGIFGPDLFAPTRAGARQRMIDAPHPTTGERVFWRPVGRPILFAGDKTLLLRTRKLARKLNAGCGVASRTFRRRRRR